jgi:glycopeptide antibiotics resistance protein
MTLRRAVVLLVLATYVAFLLDLAWLQFPSRDPVPNLVPLRSIIDDWSKGGRGFVVNFLGNIAAFVPIGMIPPLARPRRPSLGQAALFSLSLSIMIEAVQYSSGRRIADVDDLLLNTAGGILGYYVLSLLSSRRRTRADSERD